MSHLWGMAALEFSLFQWILAGLAENMNPCHYSIVKYMIK